MELIKNSRPQLSMVIVEDDMLARGLLSLMLGKNFPDFTIYLAGNGREGLELCKENLPDIVLTDIKMPEVDGLQMVEEIQSIKVNTQFIILTGHSDIAFLEKFSKIGVSNYIIKPIKLVDLYAAIEKCIAEITQNAVRSHG